jgi:hypothetical protein
MLEVFSGLTEKFKNANLKIVFGQTVVLTCGIRNQEDLEFESVALSLICSTVYCDGQSDY